MLYHELGFESLASRRWYHKLCSFVAFIKFSRLSHLGNLFEAIPTAKRAYITRNNDKLPHFKVKHNYFKNSLFPPTMIEWNRQSIKTFVIPKVSLV